MGSPEASELSLVSGRERLRAESWMNGGDGGVPRVRLDSPRAGGLVTTGGASGPGPGRALVDEGGAAAGGGGLVGTGGMRVCRGTGVLGGPGAGGVKGAAPDDGAAADGVGEGTDGG